MFGRDEGLEWDRPEEAFFSDVRTFLTSLPKSVRIRTMSAMSATAYPYQALKFSLVPAVLHRSSPLPNLAYKVHTQQAST